MAILAGDFDLAFVCKVTKATSPNDRLAYGVGLIAGYFLRTLTFNRAVDINFSASLYR